MRSNYQPAVKTAFAVVALALVPLLLIAGASGQIGVFILVVSQIIAVIIGSEFLKRSEFSKRDAQNISIAWNDSNVLHLPPCNSHWVQITTGVNSTLINPCVYRNGQCFEAKEGVSLYARI